MHSSGSVRPRVSGPGCEGVRSGPGCGAPMCPAWPADGDRCCIETHVHNCMTAAPAHNSGPPVPRLDRPCPVSSSSKATEPTMPRLPASWLAGPAVLDWLAPGAAAGRDHSRAARSSPAVSARLPPRSSTMAFSLRQAAAHRHDGSSRAAAASALQLVETEPTATASRACKTLGNNCATQLNCPR